jgi:hypothetical protein
MSSVGLVSGTLADAQRTTPVTFAVPPQPEQLPGTGVGQRESSRLRFLASLFRATFYFLDVRGLSLTPILPLPLSPPVLRYFLIFLLSLLSLLSIARPPR